MSYDYSANARVPMLTMAQIASAQGLQSHPPVQDEPEQKMRARDTSRSPRPWWQLLAFCIVLGFCILVLLIIVVFLSSSRQSVPLTSHISHNPHSQMSYIPSPHLAQFQSQDIEIFYYDFTSGSEIQTFQRHPPSGNLPDINITQLVDYRVCCTSNSHKFVCSTGNNFLEHDLALDAVLELDDYSEGMYLLLWINSEDLVEVGCVLSGSMRPG